MGGGFPNLDALSALHLDTGKDCLREWRLAQYLLGEEAGPGEGRALEYLAEHFQCPQSASGCSPPPISSHRCSSALGGQTDLITPNDGWQMPPSPHDRPWRRPTVFRDGPLSGVTENWVMPVKQKRVGRKRARERQDPCFTRPLATKYHSSLPCPNCQAFHGEEERRQPRRRWDCPDIFWDKGEEPVSQKKGVLSRRGRLKVSGSFRQKGE